MINAVNATGENEYLSCQTFSMSCLQCHHGIPQANK